MPPTKIPTIFTFSKYIPFNSLFSFLWQCRNGRNLLVAAGANKNIQTLAFHVTESTPSVSPIEHQTFHRSHIFDINIIVNILEFKANQSISIHARKKIFKNVFNFSWFSNWFLMLSFRNMLYKVILYIDWFTYNVCNVHSIFQIRSETNYNRSIRHLKDVKHFKCFFSFDFLERRHNENIKYFFSSLHLRTIYLYYLEVSSFRSIIQCKIYRTKDSKFQINFRFVKKMSQR